MQQRKLKLKSTFFGLFGYGSATLEVTPSEQLEQLRAAMLDTLGDAGCESHVKLARKLQYADDVQALWYARSELMAALAAMEGEARARKELDRLTGLFKKVLPKGMTAGTNRPPR